MQLVYGGLTYIASAGRMKFDDVYLPIAGKDAWGVDTLDREVRGPAPLMENYYRKLKQGQTYAFGGVTFYLQSWQPIGDPLFPGFRLSYKGLSNGIPEPVIEDNTAIQTATISYNNATGIDGGANLGTVTSAVKTLQYIAPTSTYRYITSGRPTSPKYSGTSNKTLTILNTTVQTQSAEKGAVTIGGTLPAALATVLTAAKEVQVVGPQVSPIFGTPYFECIDSVTYIYKST